MKRSAVPLLLAAASLLTASTTSQAINLAPGDTLAQSFSIGTSDTATLPTDWRVDKNATVRTVGSYADAGTATERAGGNGLAANAANGIYNFGAGDAASATDRAVGFLSSGTATKSGNLYVKLTNAGANPITSLTISYTVEKYRQGSNAAGFAIQLYASTDGETWTSVGSDFLTTIAADEENTGYAEAPGVSVEVSNQTLTVRVEPTGSLYLAWNYSVASGSTTSYAQALGIDDVSITANGDDGDDDPVNLPPVLTLSRGTVWTLPGEPVFVTASATDPDEGDEVTLSVSSEDIPGVVSLFNSTTGVFSWQPSALGTYEVTFQATDSHEETPGADTRTLTIHVVRSASGGFIWDFETEDAIPLETTFGIASGPISRVNGDSSTPLISDQAPSGGYTGASGGSNATASAIPRAFDRNASTYFAFTLTRTAHVPFSLSVTGVSFGARSTSTGPQALALYSSHDNYTNPLAETTAVNSGTWEWKEFVFDAVPFQESITFRLYGYDGSGTSTSANWRIDDLTVLTFQRQGSTLAVIR